MPTANLWLRLKQIATPIICLGVFVAMIWLSKPWWQSRLATSYPNLSAMLGIKATDAEADAHAGHDEHEGHDHGGPDPDILQLSRQAIQSLDLRIEPLKRSDYERPSRIPALVIEVPGVTSLVVGAKCSGEIDKIHVLEGQVTRPGEPLFEMQLTHEEAIEMQLQLLEALAKLEVEGAEVARLEQIQSSSPGAVAGTRLLEKRYEIKHLWHTIHSRRQTLILLGVADTDIDALIERHREQHDSAPAANTAHEGVPLIDRITIFAPGDKTLAGETNASDSPVLVMEKLLVRTGEHVDVGTPLCRLGNYQTLRLEGQAFERDVELVQQAIQKGWTVSARFDGPSGTSATLSGLPILYVAPSVDSASRAASFYVELPNTLREQPNMQTRSYADWKFRPGQRAEIQVPVERFPKSLVVPRTAVAEDGPHNYVFQSSGTTFVRRPVTVLYRDDDRAVLADDGSVFPGMRLAMNGAYQLQLALVNQASGPVDPHAGHSH